MIGIVSLLGTFSFSFSTIFGFRVYFSFIFSFSLLCLVLSKLTLMLTDFSREMLFKSSLGSILPCLSFYILSNIYLFCFSIYFFISCLWSRSWLLSCLMWSAFNIFSSIFYISLYLSYYCTFMILSTFSFLSIIFILSSFDFYFHFSSLSFWTRYRFSSFSCNFFTINTFVSSIFFSLFSLTIFLYSYRCSYFLFFSWSYCSWIRANYLFLSSASSCFLKYSYFRFCSIIVLVSRTSFIFSSWSWDLAFSYSAWIFFCSSNWTLLFSIYFYLFLNFSFSSNRAYSFRYRAILNFSSFSYLFFSDSIFFFSFYSFIFFTLSSCFFSI